MKNTILVLSVLSMFIWQPNLVLSQTDTADAEAEIFMIVEEPAQYPGGQEAMYKYLGENIIYPDAAREDKAEGVVYVNFVIDLDGKVTNVKVLRGIHEACDKEAIRVVSEMPPWTPARQKGTKVKMAYNLPIRFSMKGKAKKKKEKKAGKDK